MIKLKELIDCSCGSDCCSLNESTEDKIKAQKKFQSLMRQEGLMRDRMFKLEQAFLADSRPENIKLAKELKYQLLQINFRGHCEKKKNIYY